MHFECRFESGKLVLQEILQFITDFSDFKEILQFKWVATGGQPYNLVATETRGRACHERFLGGFDTSLSSS